MYSLVYFHHFVCDAMTFCPELISLPVIMSSVSAWEEYGTALKTIALVRLGLRPPFHVV